MTKILKFNNYSKIFESNFKPEELEKIQKIMNKPNASEDNLIQAMIWKLQEGEFGNYDLQEIDDDFAIQQLRKLL
jgi:hypothetical protein